MKSPKSVEIDITNRCNLRCKHCAYFSSSDETKEELSTAEWLRFFEELNACAVLDVTLSGGEPFSREDLKELVSGIIKNRMRFSILSNGTLITDEIAKFLVSSGRCNSVQVSIDGASAASHDALRGTGNFQKALNGIRHLRNNNINTTVRVTINRHNVNELDRIAELLLVDVGLPGFSTNSASYMGLCRKNTQELQLQPQDRSLAMDTLLRLNKRFNNRISAAAGPLAEARAWSAMEHARLEGKKDMPGRGFLLGCGGFLTKIAVRADGIIVPCNMLGHIELGRINKDSLKDIWQNHPKLNTLRSRRGVALSEFEFCNDCAYINYCTGNCPALAYTLTGSDFHPSPDSCLKRFLEQGGTLPHIETVAT